MRKTALLIVTAATSVTCVPALGGDFDGSKPLLCASTSLFECDADGECLRVSPNDVRAPRFLKIDVANNKIVQPNPAGDGRSTPIERSEQLDGKLILQGAEEAIEGVRDGIGWTLSINQETGNMTLTASGDDVGFVIFGACTPL